METTVVTLPNASRVYILENVFDTDALCYLHSLADGFSETNPLWHRAGTAEQYPRWEYNVQDSSFDPVRSAVDQHMAYWQQQLAPDSPRRLFCSNISFFIDYPGSPPLLAHKEGVDSWLSQVYIARQSHKYNGTTIYNDQREILFQLPYRNNMGWLFDNGSTVMHGRAHSVPEGLDRFSLMIWYALLPN